MGPNKPSGSSCVFLTSGSVLVLFSALISIFVLSGPAFAAQTFSESFESYSTISANGGSLSGGTITSAGVVDNALVLPAAGSLYYSNNGKISKSGATIVFHYKPQSTSNCGMFGLGELPAANSLGIFLATHPTYGSRHIVAEIKDSSSAYYQAWSGGVTVDTNSWMCIAVTLDCDDGITTYVDGIPGYKRTLNLCNSFTESNTINVGHSGWYSDCSAVFDEMTFHDSVLTQSEINSICSSVVCSSDSDCGTDGWVAGTETCTNGDVYQDYLTYTCSNPGTASSSCSSSQTSMLKEACQYGCSNGQCLGSGLDPQVEWLANRQDAYPTGLVDSYEGDNYTSIVCPADCPIAFTYDQATSAIAFTHAGQYTRAQAILDRLMVEQNPDGSFFGGLDAQLGGGRLEYRKSSGEVAWVIIAVNYYEKATKDTSYSSMRSKALAWLETMIDKNASHSSRGGVCIGNNWWDIPADSQCYGNDWWELSENKAFSTEHNFDAYSAFLGAANLTADLTERQRLEGIALGIADYLFRETWNGNSFYRGFRDTEIWLDPHTMAILAMGTSGPSGQDLTVGLQTCKNTMTSQLNYQAGVAVNGFSYNDYSIPIWVEGTGQMAAAYAKAGDSSNSNYYIGQIVKTVYSNGGVPYSFSDYALNLGWGYPDNQRFQSVAGTTWYYFAKNSINPMEAGPIPTLPSTSLYVNPASKIVSQGSSFQISVSIDTQDNVYAGQFELFYDPSIVTVSSVQEGGFLGSDGAQTYPVISINNAAGTVQFASTRFNTGTTVSGTGDFAVISMDAVAAGTSALDIRNAAMSDNQQPPVSLALTVTDGSITVTYLPGDVNNDCAVNIFDLAAVGIAYGAQPGDSNWNPGADQTGDGNVDIFDLAMVGLNYGSIC